MSMTLEWDEIHGQNNSWPLHSNRIGESACSPSRSYYEYKPLKLRKYPIFDRGNFYSQHLLSAKKTHHWKYCLYSHVFQTYQYDQCESSNFFEIQRQLHGLFFQTQGNRGHFVRHLSQSNYSFDYMPHKRRSTIFLVRYPILSSPQEELQANDEQLFTVFVMLYCFWQMHFACKGDQMCTVIRSNPVCVWNSSTKQTTIRLLESVLISHWQSRLSSQGSGQFDEVM